jgi:predicted MFS family arabinose efflux permease
VSAVLIRTGVRYRPAAAEFGDGLRSYLTSIGDGARYVAGHPTLRLLLGLAWIAGLLVLPEGLAAPYAVEVGAGATATGLLLASMPAGTAVGTLIFLRVVPSETRSRWMAPLAAASGLALAGCYAKPGLVCSLLLWAVSGACAAYLVQVYASYARAVPDDHRGQAIGIASTGLLVSQGLGVVLGGVAAGVWSPRTTVGLAGALEALLACLLGLAWSRLGRLDRGGRHRVVRESVLQNGIS